MTASAGRPPFPDRLRDGKTEAIAHIVRRHIAKPPQRILVVGCGSGLEAAILAQEFDAQTVGIDLSTNFDAIAATHARLQQGDATQLQFPDQSFDLVFSYHALEHIPQYRTALSEMRRVLAEEGHYCIGTPNRSRLIGYLGSKDASMRQMLMWNVEDWRARLRGRFRNEDGAHAGFSAGELRSILESIFSNVNDVTLQYYQQVYSDKARLVSVIHKSGLERFLLPSIYFFGPR